MEKYSVVEHQNIQEFTKMINLKIEEGYLPIGGVAVYKNYYIQAMVLKEFYQNEMM